MWDICIACHAYIGNLLACLYLLIYSYFCTFMMQVVISGIFTKWMLYCNIVGSSPIRRIKASNIGIITDKYNPTICCYKDRCILWCNKIHCISKRPICAGDEFLSIHCSDSFGTGILYLLIVLMLKIFSSFFNIYK
jgi:energy-coupling factor transporter transmembrane protein EcfT